MSDEPMIKLEPGGKAPILSYNVPEPTSYSGRNIIELDIPTNFFNANAKQIPKDRVNPNKLSSKQINVAVEDLENGIVDTKIFPNANTVTSPRTSIATKQPVARKTPVATKNTQVKAVAKKTAPSRTASTKRRQK